MSSIPGKGQVGLDVEPHLSLVSGAEPQLLRERLRLRLRRRRRRRRRRSSLRLREFALAASRAG
ncbi:hypothetical protein [Nocardioides insulae]|uniref:hypothetical protein n=1 Tax=Nocardioides insulae TaxID=394734 RepID=UPI0012F9BC44|nr:hypothetical protein [Nocardioides insulae]